jgi:hypothetical protein
VYPVAAVASSSTPSASGACATGLGSFFCFFEEAASSSSSVSAANSAGPLVFGRRCWTVPSSVLASNNRRACVLMDVQGLKICTYVWMCQRIEHMYVYMYI